MDHTVRTYEKSARQLTIYYNPSKSEHKRAIAYAESVSKVLAIPFQEMPTAYNIWVDIWNGLQPQAYEIFDETHPKYKQLGISKGGSFDTWYKLVTRNPELLVAPVATDGRQVALCRSYTNVLGLIGLQTSEL